MREVDGTLMGNDGILTGDDGRFSSLVSIFLYSAMKLFFKLVYVFLLVVTCKAA